MQTLGRLLSQPLGTIAVDLSGASYQTALPLWGLNIASRWVHQRLAKGVVGRHPPEDLLHQKQQYHEQGNSCRSLTPLAGGYKVPAVVCGHAR
jgi:hypothetical protein